MTQQHHTTTLPTVRRCAAAAIMALLAFALGAGTAKGAQKPTIKIVCDWDFAPYEFVNTDGQPDGYNMELLDLILNSLDIPHEFVMNARKLNLQSFAQGKADIIVDYRGRFDGQSYYRSLTPLGYYSFVTARLATTPPLTEKSQMPTAGTIVFNDSNDSISKSLFGSFADSITYEFHSPREGLNGIKQGNYPYYFWGEEAMKWKLKELSLDSTIVVDHFNMPATEIHIVGHDKHLIDEIDNAYVRLQQEGEVEKIHNRWFHPELATATTSSNVIYYLLATVLISLVMFLLYLLTRQRVRAALQRNEDMENMMHRALSLRSYMVIENDLKQGRLINIHGHALPEEGVPSSDLLKYVHPDDREAMSNRRKDSRAQKGQALPFSMRWNAGTFEQPKWINVKGYSFPEFDKTGKPVDIIITSRNITEELEKEQHENELGLRFKKMFDSSLVATSFYDKNGKLLDFNEKMRELCEINTPERERFFHSTNLADFGLLRDVFQLGNTETLHACQHIVSPKLGIDKYVEMRVRPAFDDEGELLYYIVTSRDLTDERDMYMNLKKQDIALKKAADTNNRYENELRVLMENCNMYIWHTDVKSGVIAFSRSLHEKEFTMTFDEYFAHIEPQDFEEAKNNLMKLLHTSDKEKLRQTFTFIHRFSSTPVSSEPTWYSISGMALLDDNGQFNGLFGVVRNVDSFMVAQQKLKEETARAENSALLKSTFLANMTHEIRTPLNAIVGFSDLLSMVDDPVQRKEFIGIIRNNCDMLMRLINDIFEASTMDIKPLEIVPRQVDFAHEFSIVAQSLSERIKEPAVEYIVDNPYKTFITVVDMGRMQQVITNFLTNAVKYTHQGHIRVGYRYEDNGIYMYCEDTGTGIPKDKQARVFDRFVKLNDFVQGTGLGLNICKAIAERSSGRIGLESEGENKGSLFWIWVPCPDLNHNNRKKQ